MEKNNAVNLGLAIGELIFKYGVPAAMDIVSTIDSDKPTLADIQALKNMVKSPESYLEEK